MVLWYLIVLILTAEGRPVADIPQPFTNQPDCQVAGFKRGAEIAADKKLAHGVWVCLSTNFEQDDPVPMSQTPEQLVPKRNL